MKRYFALMLLLSIYSCSTGTEEDNIPPSIKIDIPETVLPDDMSENVKATFTTSHDWSIQLSETKASPNWFDASPKSGGAGTATITISVLEANTSAKDREGIIKIKTGDLEKDIKVTQKGVSASISLDKTTQSVSATANSFNVQITTNEAAWSASDIPTWLTLSPTSGTGSGTVAISCQSNTSTSPRSATIIFTSGNSEQPLTVTQVGANAVITLDKTTQSVGATASSFNLQVTTNSATWSTSGIPSWITLDPASGVGSSAVAIAYQANTTTSPRSATITFTSGSATQTLTVTQVGAGATITLDKTTQSVDAAANSFNVQVTTNGSAWSTSGVPEWITLSLTLGTDSGVVAVSSQANPTTSSRSAKITFTSGSATQTLTVTQTGTIIDFDITPNSKTVQATANSFDLKVSTNGVSWNASNIPGWVTLSSITGSGVKTIVVSCQENSSSSPRTATITFTSEIATETLTLTQNGAGATISLDKTTQLVEATTNSFKVQVTTNDASWSTSGIPSWITLDPTASIGNRAVNVSCQANTTTSSRTATITFTSGYSTQTLIVTQKGENATITLDKESEAVSDAPNLVKVKVTINGASWSASGVPDWVELKYNTNTASDLVSVLCAQNFLTAPRTAIITFTSEGKSQTLTVTQSGAAAKIHTNHNFYSVQATADSFELTVTTNGRSWSASGVPSWLTLSSTSGNTGTSTIVISSQTNPLSSKRSAIISFTSEGAVETLEVTQVAAGSMIVFDKSDHAIGATAQSFNLQITTKGAWDTTIIPDWITLSQEKGSGSGEITVSCLSNPIAVERIGKINFYSGDANRTLTITQAGADIEFTLDKSTQSVGANANSFSVQVTTNGAKWSTSGVPDWITLHYANQTGSNKVTVACELNSIVSPRTAVIAFTAGNVTRTLTVTQAGASATISLDKSNQSVGATANSFNVAVTTNGSVWETSNVPTWITLSRASGSGSDVVSVSCHENQSYLSRTATITFTAGGTTRTLTIVQAGASAVISLDKTSQSVGSTADSFDVAVTTNGATWNTSGIPSWITLSPTSGNGNKTVTVTYQENPSTTSRTATITFTSGSSTKTLTVIQARMESSLSLDVTDMQIDYYSRSSSVFVTTNGAWSASGIPSWITLGATSGNGSGLVKIEYKENTSGVKRTATIQFTSGNVTKTLTITQEYETKISITQFNHSIGSSAKTLNINVVSNAEWSVVKIPDWITITPSSGKGNATITVTCAKNNTSSSRNVDISFRVKHSGALLSITQSASQLEDLEEEKL